MTNQHGWLKMMEEKKSKDGINPEDELAFIRMTVNQQAHGYPKQDDLNERAAGDVTFTVEQTSKIYLKGSNEFMREILKIAYQHKSSGLSLLENGEQLMEQLQEVEEKMFFTLAAMNLGIKSHTDLEVETDQAIWYYEKINDLGFMKLLQSINARNTKVMGLLMSQELEPFQILEIQDEVDVVPNVQGEIPQQPPKSLKWLMDLDIGDIQGEIIQEADESKLAEAIIPLDSVSTSVTNVIKICYQSTTNYISELLDLSEKWIKGDRPETSTDTNFQQAIKRITPRRPKAIQQLNLSISEDEYELAIIFYRQTQNIDFIKATNEIQAKLNIILSKLQNLEGLTLSDIATFRQSLSTD